jgi:hypothetical protein
VEAYASRSAEDSRCSETSERCFNTSKRYFENLKHPTNFSSRGGFLILSLVCSTLIIFVVLLCCRVVVIKAVCGACLLPDPSILLLPLPEEATSVTGSVTVSRASVTRGTSLITLHLLLPSRLPENLPRVLGGVILLFIMKR